MSIEDELAKARKALELEERKRKLRLETNTQSVGENSIPSDSAHIDVGDIERRKTLLQPARQSFMNPPNIGEVAISIESPQHTLLQLINEAYNIQIGVNNLVHTTRSVIEDLLKFVISTAIKVKGRKENNISQLNNDLKTKKQDIEDFLVAIQALSVRYVLIAHQCQDVSQAKKTLTHKESEQLNNLLELVPPDNRQIILLKDNYQTLVPYTSLDELTWLNELIQHLFRIVRMHQLLTKLLPQVQPSSSR